MTELTERCCVEGSGGPVGDCVTNAIYEYLAEVIDITKQDDAKGPEFEDMVRALRQPVPAGKVFLIVFRELGLDPSDYLDTESMYALRAAATE